MAYLRKFQRKHIVFCVIGLLVVTVAAFTINYFHRKHIEELESLSHALSDEPVAPTVANVSTNPATNITETEATLAATLVSLGGAKTVLANFVYEGSPTPITTMTATGPYSLRVTHLKCNTTYSFNAVVLNSFGSYDGPTRVFTTKACGGNTAVKTVTPTAKKSTPVPKKQK